MTFKNSCFDLALIKSRLKKSAWILTLYSITLFFAIPVANAITMQNVNNRNVLSRYSDEERIDYLTNAVSSLFSFNNKLVSFLIVLLALVAALTAFHYLNSKKQIDFYHSMPIKREKLFTASFLTGLFYFVVPYLANVCISLALIAGTGFAQYADFGAIVTTVLINLLYYLVNFSVCVFASILCGHLIVALLGSLVFLAYFPALIGIWLTHFDRYFETFYYSYYSVEELMRNVSPAFDLFYIGSLDDVSPLRIAAYIFLSAALIFLCVLLYKKRPSEAAGHAMAFRISKPLIKYPLLFVLTLCGGLFFYSAGGDSAGWMIFGYISGIILTHMVVEIIYHFDFKGIFKNLKSLVCFSVVFGAMVFAMAFDMTGYDARLPASESIQSVSLSIDRFDNMSSNLGVYNTVNYRIREQSLLEMFTLKDLGNIEAAVKLASLGIEGVLDGDDAEESLPTERVGIVFHLAGGREIRRQYNKVDMAKAQKYLMDIYNSDEYKDVLLKSLDEKTFDATNLEIKNAYFRSTNSVIAALNSPEKIKTLANAASDDLRNLRAEDMTSVAPSIILEFSWRTKNPVTNREIIEKSISVPVFENADATSRLLREYGIEIPDRITAEEVGNISIYAYSLQDFIVSSKISGSQMKEIAIAMDKDVAQVVFNDKKDIANILPYLIPEESSRYNPFLQTDNTCSATINSSTYMNGYSEPVVFVNNTMPAFVRQKIEEKAAELLEANK